jgi:hypothetical protein
MPSAKLLIIRWFMVRNQQVAGSIPAGGSSLSSKLKELVDATLSCYFSGYFSDSILDRCYRA